MQINKLVEISRSGAFLLGPAEPLRWGEDVSVQTDLGGSGVSFMSGGIKTKSIKKLPVLKEVISMAM